MSSVMRRAFLIAQMEERGEPMVVEEFDEFLEGKDDLRATKRDLERLVSEDVAVRTEHSTYCHTCGSDSGVEYRYSLAKEPS